MPFVSMRSAGRLRLTAAAAAMLMFSVAPARAEPAMESLRHFYESVRTLHADFSQVLLDAEMNVKEESGGEVWLARPDRFRWEYDTPFEQVIVSDGEQVRLYDVDLAQVTVRPMTEALAATPAQLLAGGADLDKRFEMESLGEMGGTRWVKLTPVTQDTDFKQVRLGFVDGGIRVMELRDNFGQTTRIRFRNIETNLELAPGTFELEVPEDVDVVGG